jgi:PhzF family phenazine biosynthesis protein
MHARHFSSPYSGTVEDAVTGTASGVMRAFFAKYIKNNNLEEPLNLIVEQGNEIQKDGRVTVQVSKSSESYDVEITGNAVHVKDFDVCIRDE